jgi:hypothetical protein
MKRLWRWTDGWTGCRLAAEGGAGGRSPRPLPTAVPQLLLAGRTLLGFAWQLRQKIRKGNRSVDPHLLLHNMKTNRLCCIQPGLPAGTQSKLLTKGLRSLTVTVSCGNLITSGSSIKVFHFLQYCEIQSNKHDIRSKVDTMCNRINSNWH